MRGSLRGRSLKALVVIRRAILACVGLQRLIELQRLSFTAYVQAVAARLVQRPDGSQQPGIGVAEGGTAEQHEQRDRGQQARTEHTQPPGRLGYIRTSLWKEDEDDL